MLKQNDPASRSNGEQGQAQEIICCQYNTIPAKFKGVIVAAVAAVASRGFIPPSWATLALRVLFLKGA